SLTLGFGEETFGLLLRAADDLFAGRHPELLRARLLEDLVGVLTRFHEEILAVLHDPSRLLDLLRQGLAHLRDQLEHLVAVQQGGRGQGHRLRLRHHVLQLLEARREIHQSPLPSFSASRSTTTSGTSEETSPPKRATSRTSEEER